MFVLFLPLLGIGMFSTFSSQAGCGPATPISLPIRNVTVSAASNIVRRGVPLSFGTPAQTMCMAVNGDYNNTLVWGTGGRCQNTTTQSCTFARGGAFDPSGSSTWDSNADQTNETASSGVGTFVIAYPLGADTVTLQSQKPLEVKDFPIKTPGLANPAGADFPSSSFGLGNNSTMLERLYKSNLISSRSWSLWWGLEGAEEQDQMDGSLVLGGYDVAKTTGSNFTSSFTPALGCPSSLLINLSDVRLDFPNGTQTTLLSSSGSSMRACIKPDDSLMSLPLAVWQSFVAAAGGTFIGGSPLAAKGFGMDYSTDEIFQGNMTFVLNSGLSVTIPNHQLIVPDVRIADDGTLQIEKEDEREVLIYATGQANANDMPLLGQPFLSALYLHVNNDERSFTLWKANPTTDEKLVAVGIACAESSTPSSTKPSSPSSLAGPSSPSTPSAPSSVAESSPKTHQASTGTVAAAAIAGMAALTIPIIILLWRRKRASAKRSQTANDNPFHDRNSIAFDTFKEVSDRSSTSTSQHLSKNSSANEHELEWQPVYEMPADRTSRKYELPPGGRSPEPPPLPPVPLKDGDARRSAGRESAGRSARRSDKGDAGRKVANANWVQWTGGTAF